MLSRESLYYKLLYIQTIVTELGEQCRSHCTYISILVDYITKRIDYTRELYRHNKVASQIWSYIQSSLIKQQKNK